MKLGAAGVSTAAGDGTDQVAAPDQLRKAVRRITLVLASARPPT